MKVAVMYSPKHKKLEAFAKVLGQSLEKGGHRVDYVHIEKNDRPVSVNRYDYVYLGSVPEGTFGGKIPIEVTEFVKQCRGIQHAKSAAFMTKGLMFNTKALRRLMEVLESTGSLVMDFQLIISNTDAERLAQRLKN
jgi:flavorubredoxin